MSFFFSNNLLLLIVCRAYVTEVHRRSDTILQNQAKQQTAGTAQVASVGYDHVQNSMNEIKESLNALKRDMSITAQRLAAQPATCPPSQPCLNTTVFLVIMVAHVIVMIGYFIYRYIIHLKCVR